MIQETLRILRDAVMAGPEHQRVFVEMAMRDEQVRALKVDFDSAARLTELVTRALFGIERSAG